MSCDLARQCLLEGRCVDEGTEDNTNNCMTCNPAVNPRAWTPKAGCEAGGLLSTTEIIVLVVLILVFLLCVLLLVLYCIRRRKRKSQKEKEPLSKSAASSQRLSQFSNGKRPAVVNDPRRAMPYPYANGYSNGLFTGSRTTSLSHTLPLSGQVTTVQIPDPPVTRVTDDYGYATFPGYGHERDDSPRNRDGVTTLQLGVDSKKSRYNENIAMLDQQAREYSGGIDIHSDIPPGPFLSDTRSQDSHFGYPVPPIPPINDPFLIPGAPQQVPASASISVQDNAAIKIPLGTQTLPIQISQKKKQLQRRASTESFTKVVSFEEALIDHPTEAKAFVGRYDVAMETEISREKNEDSEPYTIVAPIGMAEEHEKIEFQKTYKVVSED